MSEVMLQTQHSFKNLVLELTMEIRKLEELLKSDDFSYGVSISQETGEFIFTFILKQPTRFSIFQYNRHTNSFQLDKLRSGEEIIKPVVDFCSNYLQENYQFTHYVLDYISKNYFNHTTNLKGLHFKQLEKYLCFELSDSIEYFVMSKATWQHWAKKPNQDNPRHQDVFFNDQGIIYDENLNKIKVNRLDTNFYMKKDLEKAQAYVTRYQEDYDFVILKIKVSALDKVKNQPYDRQDENFDGGEWNIVVMEVIEP